VSELGRETAPVELPVPLLGVERDVSTAGAGRGSRLLRMRVRRSSPSSGTPGVRAAAPVERSAICAGGLTRAGRPPMESPRSPPEAELLLSGARAGRPRSGALPITRRAISSVARCGRRSSLPICRAVAVVTARNSSGFIRRRPASSSPRNAVSRAGLLL
jgi:hypothetical protein